MKENSDSDDKLCFIQDSWPLTFAHILKNFEMNYITLQFELHDISI